MSEGRVAVVTGSSRGVGFEVVRSLAAHFDGVVYLTARDVEAGKAATEEINREYKNVRFHQLDIEDEESIERFADHLFETHGGLDVLINNAAINIKPSETEKFDLRAREIIRINYSGTMNICSAMLPLLRSHGRIVNVACRSGMLRLIRDQATRNTLASDDLNLEDLEMAMQEYVESAQLYPDHPSLSVLEELEGSLNNFEAINSKYKDAYKLPNPFSMSKIGVIALTKIQQTHFNHEQEREGVIANAVCPGIVSNSSSTLKQGIDTIVYLALLPKDYNGPKGALWAEMKVIDWTDA